MGLLLLGVSLAGTVFISMLTGALGPIGEGVRGPLGPKAPGAPGTIAWDESLRIVGNTGTEAYRRWVLDDPSTDFHSIAIYDLRLPRALLALVVGLALGVAGSTMQGVFRNPLADPYVVGVSSGAALAATLLTLNISSLVLAGLDPRSAIFLLPLVAFTGGFLTIMAVLAVARAAGRVEGDTLLLCGVAISALLSSCMTYLMFTAGEQYRALFGFLLGGLSGASWPTLKVAAVIILIGTFLLCLLGRELDVYVQGDTAALSLGQQVHRTRVLLVLLATLVTATAVGFAGVIGFVGLIIPHAARFLVGPSHRLLLPASAMAGGAFLVLADVAARAVLSPVEVPVGVITALLGAPVFIWLLVIRRRRVAA